MKLEEKSIKLFWIVGAFFFTIFVSNPAIALVTGVAISLIFGNAYCKFTSMLSKRMLEVSVVLLGFGIQLSVIIKVGASSVWITLIGIVLAFSIGMFLGKLFKIDKNTSILLTSGTAICGGSAIAAIAPSINAKQGEIAVSMAVVFLLNAIGLVVFPFIAHMLNLSEADFGLWAALAIHDTSSVVGAAAGYGALALTIATTVKLTRALWILPVAIIASKLTKSEGKPKFQWFLLGFLLAGLINSFFPQLINTWEMFATTGKMLMSGTLFLVGAGLTMKVIKEVGAKALIMAVILWIIMSIISLAAILTGVWQLPTEIFLK